MVSQIDLDWVRGIEEPLQAKTSVRLESWEAVALVRPDDFASDLTAIGLAPEEVASGIGVRDASAAMVEAAVRNFWRSHDRRYIETPPDVAEQVDFIYSQARQGAVNRLRDWFSNRQIQVVDRQPIDLRLPLFTLAAPNAAGASVGFEATRKVGHTVDWSVTMAGTGLTGEATVSTQVSVAFGAKTGEAKLVFLPVTVMVEKLMPGDGQTRIRISFADLPGNPPVPAILLLSDRSRPAAGALTQTYALSGDSSGDLATYTHIYEQKVAPVLNVGFKAFGADITLKYGPTLEASVELKFNLPGGRDYRLFRLAQGDGVLWGE